MIVRNPSATGREATTASVPPVTTLSAAVAVLGVLIAVTSVAGPLLWGVMRYRTSPTTLNQLLGGDAAALFVIAPLAGLASVLVSRRHAAGTLLASGIGVFALYTYTQVIVGQEYLRLPGNVEAFFPLLLAVFVLAGATVVIAWRAMPTRIPALPRRLERIAGGVLLALAVFLVAGRHLRPLLLAWSDPTSLTEYASSPTPFWLVKLMDLGIIVPIATATGVGLLRRAAWARRVMYPLLTAYTLLGVSVTAMGLVMNLHGDPDASLAMTGGFAAFTAVFAALTVALYRPLFARSEQTTPEARPDSGVR